MILYCSEMCALWAVSYLWFCIIWMEPHCEVLLGGLDSTVGDDFFFRRREYGFAAGMVLLRIEMLFEGRLIGSGICFLDACGRFREASVFLEAFRAESPSCMHKSTCSLRERSSYLRAILFLLVTVCARMEGGIICFRRSGGDRD